MLIVILFTYNISNELGWNFWNIGILINAVVHPIAKVRRSFFSCIVEFISKQECLEHVENMKDKTVSSSDSKILVFEHYPDHQVIDKMRFYKQVMSIFVSPGVLPISGTIMINFHKLCAKFGEGCRVFKLKTHKWQIFQCFGIKAKFLNDSVINKMHKIIVGVGCTAIMIKYYVSNACPFKSFNSPHVANQSLKIPKR